MPFGLKNKLNSPLQELTHKVRALKTKNLSLNSAVLHPATFIKPNHFGLMTVI